MDHKAKEQGKTSAVWDEIRDTWGKINDGDAKPENVADMKVADMKNVPPDKLPVMPGSRLAQDIQKAGGLAKTLVEKIYQCYEFCAGFSVKDLKEMGTLETFKVKQAMESQAANDSSHNFASNGDSDEGLSFGSGSFGSWESFSPSVQKTWPDHKHNVVFGPRLIRPVMALFLNGKWFHDGTNKPIEGITKFQYIDPPEDWV